MKAQRWLLVLLVQTAWSQSTTLCLRGQPCVVNVSLTKAASEFFDWGIWSLKGWTGKMFENQTVENNITSTLYLSMSGCISEDGLIERSLKTWDWPFTNPDMITLFPDVFKLHNAGTYALCVAVPDLLGGLADIINTLETIPMAKITLLGIDNNNEASCVKGSLSCNLTLRGDHLSHVDVLKVALSDTRQGCGADIGKVGFANLTTLGTAGFTNARGLAFKAVQAGSGAPFEEFMAIKAGIYDLCWCRPYSHPKQGDVWTNLLRQMAIANNAEDEYPPHQIGQFFQEPSRGSLPEWFQANLLAYEETQCENTSDAFVFAGTLAITGPFTRPNSRHVLGSQLNLESVTGYELSASDRVRLQQTCGNLELDFIEATSTSAGSEADFDFGVPTNKDLLAVTYELCWCQPTGEMNCTKPGHFRVGFGSVEISCPSGSANVNGDGLCHDCGFWNSPDSALRSCEPDAGNIVLTALCCMLLFLGWCFLMTTLSAHQFKLVGRFVYIEDISLEEDRVILYTVSAHCLRTAGRAICVTLVDTGHFCLDSRPGSLKTFRVRVAGTKQLELLGENGTPILNRVDSSMGYLVMRPWDSVIHRDISSLVTLPATPVALLLLVMGHVLFFRFLGPQNSRPGPQAVPPSEMIALFDVLDAIAAFGVVSLVRCFSRPMTLLSHRIVQFEKKLKRPNPTACERGPQRAITAFQLFDFGEYFSAFIRDRTMYYIDPNIVRPLTQRNRLSFAERIGPSTVQFFISHWWGTRFQDFCSAVRRHAMSSMELRSESGQSSMPLRSESGQTRQGDRRMQISYWICIFSNNQYRLSEELGKEHYESSFYLALHSPGCRGTCMILDELAMPLTRSWCLFELLQTLKLEQMKSTFEGLFFCTSTGVLNLGHGTTDLALQIGAKVASISLEDAEAKFQADKDMINSLVLAEMGNFQKINKELRTRIGEALLACKKHVEADFAMMLDHLKPPTTEL